MRDSESRFPFDFNSDCRGLILGVESECAAAAVVGASLGLAMAALLFCSDNVTLANEGDRSYRGLANENVRRGFETGLAAVVEVLSGHARTPK